MTDEQDVTTGGEGVDTAVEPSKGTEHKEVSEARSALVKEIIEDAKESKTHHESVFKRMRHCMKLAAHGTTDATRAEALDGAYVVPVLNRHINQAVASLYAKNPKAVAKRKDKLLYKIWDGDETSLAAAMQVAQQAASTPAAVDPMTGQSVVDPAVTQAVQLLEEVQAAKAEIIRGERIARTLALCYAYFLDEQDAGYKEQFKALVRRTKVCGVGWVKLGYQRILKLSPDQEGQIADSTQKISAMEAGLAALSEGKIEEQSARMEELRLLVKTVQESPELVVREGPVFSFPRSTEVYPDRRCRHLKTLAGTRRLFHEFHMRPDDIKEIYGCDVAGQYQAYSSKGEKKDSRGKDTYACVWEVQDKKTGQVYTVCDGYSDFLKEPAEPDVKIERFWTLFPLVFNEIESDEEIYPPSDVWNARHMQGEINTNRQGLKEHRIAARPRYASSRGKLEEEDKRALGNSEAFSVTELNGLTPGEKIGDVLQGIPTPGVDPNLYETDTALGLLQNTVGSQQANLGGTSGDTATETSIAEQSRMTATGSDIDDLDNLLTALARATGQLMLQELSKDTVIEIAGPGAVWPDLPPTREQIAKDLLLGIEAGSNGRPNKAAELANFERAGPWVTMIPGIPPKPLAKKALALLDIDTEDNFVEGMPSIQAMNRMAGGAMQAGAGANAPGEQGDQGRDNAPKQEQPNEPQPQPAYPTGSDMAAPV